MLRSFPKRREAWLFKMIFILFWLKFSLKTASCVSTLKRNTRHWCCIEKKSKSWARTLTWKCQEKVFPLILFTTFFTMYKKRSPSRVTIFSMYNASIQVFCESDLHLSKWHESFFLVEPFCIFVSNMFLFHIFVLW